VPFSGSLSGIYDGREFAELVLKPLVQAFYSFDRSISQIFGLAHQRWQCTASA
jgi:hypothetical protein